MTMNKLNWKEISPTDSEKGCVITLHGRGTSGEDLMPLANDIDLPNLRWIFPDAPFPFPDLLGGLMWYGSRTGNSNGILSSRKLLFDLLDHLIDEEGVPPEDIALLGFSQGAVMALDVALRYSKRVGALIAMSGFLATPEKLNKEKSLESLSVPILLAHGVEDEVVSVDGSREALKTLMDEGYTVALQEYDMGHQIVPEEIVHIREHLQSHLGLP
ncbi:hypothetical protein MNBD_NITROSPIRAE01-1248 [hydrothermal vent metagenome]|uniref:Phospholipase/carboxylesterase/thioesterase domain-containing protein n=1 Tax=hydrothermal vent metagenome TaxID=652676 RepID=A0A3B1DKH7_9ZZZZ